MSRDMPPEGDNALHGIGGERAQKILREEREQRWIEENEKPAKDTKSGKKR